MWVFIVSHTLHVIINFSEIRMIPDLYDYSLNVMFGNKATPTIFLSVLTIEFQVFLLSTFLPDL